MAPSWPLAVAAAALLLAGCAQAPAAHAPPGSAAGSASGTPAAPAANATVPSPPPPPSTEYLLHDCAWTEGVFLYPVAALEGLGAKAPEGFRMRTADPAGTMASVSALWWDCPEGERAGESPLPYGRLGAMLIGIGLVPPAGLATNATTFDLLPLTWVVSEPTLAAALFEVLEETVSEGEVQRTGALSVTEAGAVAWTATAGYGTFALDAAAAQPASLDSWTGRVWQVTGGKATGHLAITAGAFQGRGGGASTLHFQGDLDTGAPPETPGLTSFDVERHGFRIHHVPGAA